MVWNSVRSGLVLCHLLGLLLLLVSLRMERVRVIVFVLLWCSGQVIPLAPGHMSVCRLPSPSASLCEYPSFRKTTSLSVTEMSDMFRCRVWTWTCAWLNRPYVVRGRELKSLLYLRRRVLILVSLTV